jgi:hypothetical protein
MKIGVVSYLVIDITEHKLMEIELIKAKEVADAAAITKANFLAQYEP